VRRKRSSRKRRPHVGKFKRSGIEVCVQPGFSPNLVDTVTFGNVCDDGSKAKTRKVDKFYVDVPYENSVHDGLRADQNIDADGSSSLPQGFITNDVPQNRIAVHQNIHLMLRLLNLLAVALLLLENLAMMV